MDRELNPSPADVVRNLRCRICDNVLRLRQAARGVCDAVTCQRAYLKLQSELARQRDAEARVRYERLRDEATRARRQIVAAGPGDDPASYPLAIIPSNDYPLSFLPESRKAEFRAHLKRVIREAFAAAPEPSSDHPSETKAASKSTREPDAPAETVSNGSRTEQASRQLAILGQACAVCRGRCCQQGGVEAYLDAATIRDYAALHPERNPEQIFQDYLSYLPDFTFAESCVYHTQAGCALPREMRSEVSRTFLCEGLARFRDELVEGEHERGCAVATRDGQILRVALIDARR